MTKIVAFQGVKGAYSEQAALQFFKGRTKADPSTEFVDVFEKVTKNKVDYGILPIENSLTGSIHQNYDLLLQNDVWIIGEVKLRISHNLLVYPGTIIQDIKTVYSHPQALMQCQKFLKSLKGAMPLPYFDTAGSASYVLEQKDRSIAAVASLQAAKVNKLTVLKSAIEDNEHNFTRFLVIVPRSKKTVKPKSTDRFKTSLLFALKKNLPGGLFKALTVFAMRDIDLLKIESRPIPGKPWEYIFYLDLAGSVHNIAVEKAIGHLEEVSEFVKVLGSYPPA